MAYRIEVYVTESEASVCIREGEYAVPLVSGTALIPVLQAARLEAMSLVRQIEARLRKEVEAAK